MKYILIEETLENIDCGKYITYGICVQNNGSTLQTIHDLSVDKAEISKLIDKLNTQKLQLCHLEQEVEDFLCDMQAD